MSPLRDCRTSKADRALVIVPGRKSALSQAFESACPSPRRLSSIYLTFPFTDSQHPQVRRPRSGRPLLTNICAHVSAKICSGSTYMNDHRKHARLRSKVVGIARQGEILHRLGVTGQLEKLLGALRRTHVSRFPIERDDHRRMVVVLSGVGHQLLFHHRFLAFRGQMLSFDCHQIKLTILSSQRKSDSAATPLMASEFVRVCVVIDLGPKRCRPWRL
ncbi:hypothetical protein C2E23DRAFT_607790 [Lenzites betulinus]|nr:hypothetical protein C2E23DRAFT_607790 [Lenzites betulinus]